MNTKHTIEIKGKTYGYWINEAGLVADRIRSETNPYKTPYLKMGSPNYRMVAAAIAAKHAS